MDTLNEQIKRGFSELNLNCPRCSKSSFPELVIDEYRITRDYHSFTGHIRILQIDARCPKCNLTLTMRIPYLEE